MPEYDFHGLRDAAADAARQPEFASVQQRASRLRTRRYATAAGTAAVLSVAAVLAGSALAAGGDQFVRPAASDRPAASGSPGADPSGGPGPNWRTVQWAGAGDADHLYAVLAECQTCPQRLMGSDDGGRTWRERHAFTQPQFPPIIGRLLALGPRTLLHSKPVPLSDLQQGRPGAGSSPRPPGGPAAGPKATQSVGPVSPRLVHRPWRISTDGGAQWRDLTVSATPVAAAPAGTSIVSCMVMPERTSTERCPFHVVDPVAGRAAPLATQPPLLRGEVAQVPAGAGLWVHGYDPASHRPAVAVSRDGGRNWSRTVFTTEPAVPISGEHTPTMHLPYVTTADGRTAYAMFVPGTGHPRVYRSTDGGTTWQRTNPDAPLGSDPLASPESWVTADGAHVVLDQPDGLARFLASADGKRYSRLSVTGLDAELDGGESLQRPTVTDGRYVLAGADTVYVSEDGRQWRAALR